METIAATKPTAEALARWATAFGIVIAVATGILAAAHSFLERRHERWLRARELCDDYLKMSIDHPEFFLGYWKRKDISRVDRERYVAFVSYMLNGVEDILLIDRRVEWKESLKGDLRFHQHFLRSEYFAKLKPGYFEPVREVIDEVITEPDFEVSYA